MQMCRLAMIAAIVPITRFRPSSMRRLRLCGFWASRWASGTLPTCCGSGSCWPANKGLGYHARPSLDREHALVRGMGKSMKMNARPARNESMNKPPTEQTSVNAVSLARPRFWAKN